MDKVTELSDIGWQLSELARQQQQAQRRALQDGNWTENNRLQARSAELMKRKGKLNGSYSSGG
jgi:hypothetical protein